MKKLLWIGALSALLLAACGDEAENTKEKPTNETVNKVEEKVEEPQEEIKNLTIEEYESRISQALKEMGNNTNLKIVSTEKQEDGQTVITLSENVMIFITTNEKEIIERVALGVMPEVYLTDKDDFRFALLLLVGTVDDSLSMGDRNLIIKELGLDNDENLTEEQMEIYKNNDITYTYKGSIKEHFILQAEFK